LAIFTGQVVAALVTGNTVIAKPADQTSIIANYAVKLMHSSGVPVGALQLIVAHGSSVGEILVQNDDVNGIVFTGSTSTAKLINLTVANRRGALIPIIAETGGQNAMIIDSSALLEQVVDDIIVSAFGSSGQRCSALRVAYVQEEIYDDLLKLLSGAMDLLKVTDTLDLSADMGAVIDNNASSMLHKHVSDMSEKGFNIVRHHQNGHASGGYFVYPHIIEVGGINDIPDEKFGPILHIAKYRLDDVDHVINDINSYGFGLTFGIHSRVPSRVEYIQSKMKTGNIYVNRSMIGAQVESQPFGGENKSGTGFKAGGPHYLLKFLTERAVSSNLTSIGGNIELLNRK
jgi:RHH-type proline utilization regulon transcriptional repressor/proline dehydrogenase/delta 1-pyrroline-5-carboxylate dehydrogenase